MSRPNTAQELGSLPACHVHVLEVRIVGTGLEDENLRINVLS